MSRYYEHTFVASTRRTARSREVVHASGIDGGPEMDIAMSA